MIQELIIAEARTWIGTPFFPKQAVKGIGADCVQSMLQVFKNVGAIPVDVELPDYRIAAGQYLDDSMVTAWLSQSIYFVPANGIQSADLLTLKAGRVEHHIGLVSGKTTFIQMTEKYGMVERDLRDSTWMNRIRGIWRHVKCLEIQTR